MAYLEQTNGKHQSHGEKTMENILVKENKNSPTQFGPCCFHALSLIADITGHGKQIVCRQYICVNKNANQQISHTGVTRIRRMKPQVCSGKALVGK